MEKIIRCPKYGQIERTEADYLGKQRHKCKNYRCNHAGGKNGYPEHVKQKAIQYYLEGNGFRMIERLMHVSHVSVINWLKQAADKIRKMRKVKNEKTDILKLDKVCVSYKKIWFWTAVSRKTKNLVGFFVGDRSSKSFEKLYKNIAHIDAKFYVTSKYSAYDIIPPDKHLIVKSHTYTVE